MGFTFQVSGCLKLSNFFCRKVILVVPISILSIKHLLPSVYVLNLNPVNFNILHHELITPQNSNSTLSC
jgi:hypothetical protein